MAPRRTKAQIEAAAAKRVARAATRAREEVINESASNDEDDNEPEVTAADAAAAANAGPGAGLTLQQLQEAQIRQTMRYESERFDKEMAREALAITQPVAAEGLGFDTGAGGRGYHEMMTGKYQQSLEFTNAPAFLRSCPQKEVVKMWSKDPNYNTANIYLLLNNESFDAPGDRYEQYINTDGRIETRAKPGGKDDYGGITAWSQAFLKWMQIRLYFDKDLDAQLKHYEFHSFIVMLATTYIWDGVLELAVYSHRIFWTDPSGSWEVQQTDVARFCIIKTVPRLQEPSSGSRKERPNKRGRTNTQGDSMATCHDFQQEKCTRGNCRFAHRCAVPGCGGEHPEARHSARVPGLTKDNRK
jgi:hypothetical protein